MQYVRYAISFIIEVYLDKKSILPLEITFCGVKDRIISHFLQFYNFQNSFQTILSNLTDLPGVGSALMSGAILEDFEYLMLLTRPGTSALSSLHVDE